LSSRASRLDVACGRFVAAVLGPSIALGLALLGCSEKEAEPTVPEVPIIERARTRGAMLEAEGRWVEAAALFRNAAFATREHAETLELAGRAITAFVAANDLAGARGFAEDLLDRRPGTEEALLWLADAESVATLHESARDTLEQLITKQPQNPRARLLLAHVLNRLRLAKEAITHLDAAFAAPLVGPRLLRQAELEMARALRQEDRLQEAADRLVALLEARPDAVEVLWEASRVFQTLGQSEVARDLRERHRWLTSRGHGLDAEDPIELRVSRGVSAGVRIRQALRAADRHELARALRELGAVVADEPDDETARHALARTLLRTLRCAEVCELLAAPARTPLSRSDRWTRETLVARAFLGMDRVADARATIVTIAARVAGDVPAEGAELADLLHETIEIASDCQAPVDSLAALAALANSLDRSDPVAMAAAAEVAAREGRLDDAVLLVEAMPVSDTSRHSRRTIALVRGLRGDRSFAARELTELAQSSPNDLATFRAFASVFETARSDPEIAPVFELARVAETRVAALRAARARLDGVPLDRSGRLYLELAAVAAASAEPDVALDLFWLAADLDVESTAALTRVAAALEAVPAARFRRLHVLARILERDPTDAAALELSARAHLDLGVRREHARALARRLSELRPGPASAALLEASERPAG